MSDVKINDLVMKYIQDKNEKLFNRSAGKAKKVISKSKKTDKKINNKFSKMSKNDDVLNYSVGKFAKEYQENGGSFVSLMNETTTNFNVQSRSAREKFSTVPLIQRIKNRIQRTTKKLNDLVLYVAKNETIKYNTEEGAKQFSELLKKSEKCSLEYEFYAYKYAKVYTKNAKIRERRKSNPNYRDNLKNLDSCYPTFKSALYPPEVVEMVKLAFKMRREVVLAEVFTKNNYVVLSPEEMTVFQQALETNIKTPTRLENVLRSNNRVIANSWNEISHIDSTFSSKYLPNEFSVPVDNVSNANIVNFEPDYNSLIVEKDNMSTIQFPVEDKTYIDEAIKFCQNDSKKPVEITMISDVDYSVNAQVDKAGKLHINTNSNQTMQEIINMIFQVEKNNCVLKKSEIAKKLNIKFKWFFTSFILSKKNAKKMKFNYRWNDDANKKLYKSLDIKEYKFKSHNYLSVIKRAIAVGNTINAIKLNKFSDNPLVTRTAVAYLEMELQKSIAFLSNNQSDWIVPYITMSVSEHFEKTCKQLNLTNIQAIARLKENGVPVIADENSTFRQIAFGKSAIKYAEIIKEHKNFENLDKLEQCYNAFLTAEKKKELEKNRIQYLAELRKTDVYKAIYEKFVSKNIAAVSKLVENDTTGKVWDDITILIDEKNFLMKKIVDPRLTFVSELNEIENSKDNNPELEAKKAELIAQINTYDGKNADTLAQAEAFIEAVIAVIKKETSVETNYNDNKNDIAVEELTKNQTENTEENNSQLTQETNSVAEVTEEQNQQVEEVVITFESIKKIVEKQILKARNDVVQVLIKDKTKYKSKERNEGLNVPVLKASQVYDYFTHKSTRTLKKDEILKEQLQNKQALGTMLDEEKIMLDAMLISDDFKDFSFDMTDVFVKEINTLCESGQTIKEAKSETIKKYRNTIFEYVKNAIVIGIDEKQNNSEKGEN